MGTDGATLADYDPFAEAVGLLRAANVPGPYAIAARPRTLTDLELLKEESGSNKQLEAPAGLPPLYTTSQLSVTETQGVGHHGIERIRLRPERGRTRAPRRRHRGA